MNYLHERLLAATTSRHAATVLRAVVELHEPCSFLRRPLDIPICETCSTDDDLHDVPWPCETVQLIARELRVNLAIGFGEALGWHRD